jgi:hypothetical protein
MSQELEFPDFSFSRLHDAVDAVVVARVSVADIFLEEFAHDVFSSALRERVVTLLEARTCLDDAACAYCAVGGLHLPLEGQAQRISDTSAGAP